jgi:hypothetical protein
VHWENIDPTDFNNGVYYLPDRIELQPREPHWGHPTRPGMRERVVADRPHGINGRKLLCLLCMRIQAENNLERKPVWLTFVNNPRKPFFRHEGNQSPHAEHIPESDTHKALKERKARTLDDAGALSVDVEVWRPRARRRPDIVAVGPTLTLAGEVQHSKASTQIIRNRQKALTKAGDRVVWTTDHDADDIGFLHSVPHLAIQDLNDFRLYLREDRLEINAGAITFEEQRCGWSDIWNGNTNRCPVTGKAIPCGRLHLYPTFNPKTYIRQAAATAARFPCGPRLHLDHMLEGILHGGWLPYRNRNRILWIPSDVHDDVTDERGGSVEDAESGNDPRRNKAARRACEQRVGVDRLGRDEVTVAPVAVQPPRGVSAPQRGVCGSGVVPCGQPARFYPAGWRCDEHAPSSPWRRR